jgi:hypothetical protein
MSVYQLNDVTAVDVNGGEFFRSRLGGLKTPQDGIPVFGTHDMGCQFVQLALFEVEREIAGKTLGDMVAQAQGVFFGIDYVDYVHAHVPLGLYIVEFAHCSPQA